MCVNFLRKVRRADLLLIVCSCGKVIPCSSYSVAEESFQLLTKKTFAVQTDIRQNKIVCLAIDGLEKKKNHKEKMTLTILQVKDVCVNDPKVCFGQ